MSSKTFSNIDQDLVGQVRTKLGEFGIKLEGDQGKISHMGVSANYLYDPAAKQLTISNLDVGFPASLAGYTPEKIFTQIEEAIAKRI